MIHPSLAGAGAVEARYPRAGRPAPRGRAAGPLSRRLSPTAVAGRGARAAFGDRRTARVVAFLGLVRPYKNVPAPDPHGPRASGPETAEWCCWWAARRSRRSSRRKCARPPAGIPGCASRCSMLPEEDVQRYLRRRPIWSCCRSRTSPTRSSALLALSFDRPVLVPGPGRDGRAPGARRRRLGAHLRGRADPATSSPRRSTGRGGRTAPGPPPLEPLDWPEIARADARALYRRRARIAEVPRVSVVIPLYNKSSHDRHGSRRRSSGQIVLRSRADRGG